jgi:YesN/AraC family two-component response regulator
MKEHMFKAYFIDDEPLVLEEFHSNPLFTDYGYQAVGSATNPLKAIAEIKELLPDVVFTDLRMPDLSGVDLIEQLRDEGVDCDFIIISAFPEFDEQRRFFLLDGFDYLLKPVSDESLQNLLSRLSPAIAGKNAAGAISAEWGDTSSGQLVDIVAYLKENISGKHTLESVAEKHHLSDTSVYRLFTGHLGMTFSTYMTRIRMEEATRLLKETGKDVKEIARLCGYSDYFYFCRVFKKHYSCTPTNFRERRD